MVERHPILHMNKIGYNATAHLIAGGPQYPFIQNSSNKIQVGYSQWFQDYPAASDFLDILLGCGSFHPNSNSSPNIAEFCNKPIQAKMDQAGAMGLTPRQMFQVAEQERQGLGSQRDQLLVRWVPRDLCARRNVRCLLAPARE